MKRELFIVFCLLPFAVFCQPFTYSQSEIITSPPPVIISPAQITRDFKPNIINLEMPSPGGNSYRSFLMRQKELLKTSGSKKTGSLGEMESVAREKLHTV